MRRWTLITLLLAAIVAWPPPASARQGRVLKDMSTTMSNDLELLTKLNDDYIQSVQHSNVKRFDEMLSDDFLCSMADGSLLDRKAFLEQTAKPVTIRNLQAH